MNGKTPQYTKDAINKYNAKFDRVAVNLPKGTKERIKELTGMSCNAYINKLVLNELDKLEKQDKQFEKMIYKDILREVESIDNDLIAAGIPDMDPAKKAEIKEKIYNKINEKNNTL